MKAKAKYGQALRLASTTQLTREQWLAIRKLGIGSSDAAVAVGALPLQMPAQPVVGEDRSQGAGGYLPQGSGAVGHRAGAGVGGRSMPNAPATRCAGSMRYCNTPKQPFMLANLDREVVGHPDGPGILEIKTASYHSAPQWEEGGAGGLSVSGTASIGGYRPCLG